MPDATTQIFDPTDGTTPVVLPVLEECCQAPCDPPWRTKASCITFTETKTLVVDLPSAPRTNDFRGGQVIISVTYEHRLCLVGKQHGGLAYTLTLLPGEKMTIYQSDRYRRTTSETARFSVQTTFSQFTSALHQQRNSDDSTSLKQLLDSTSGGDASAGGLGIALPLGVLGTVSGSEHSSSHSSVNDLSTHSSSDQFVSTAEQASQYTDMQRSITISTFEDTESVSTTQRTLVNNNACYAVNYFVRKVLDVYVVTTKVIAVTFQVKAAKFVSPVLTPDEIGQLPAALRAPVAAILKGLPKVGEVVEHPRVLTVPTDGVVYDPELSHCSSCEPALEQAALIKLEREQAEAQKIGLELQLMELEVQRRQALLAAGTLDAFEAAPASTVPA